MKFWQRVRHVVALVASSVVLASGLTFFSPQAAQAAPVVWNLSASTGHTSGGLVVNIVGTGLSNTTSVTFGGTAGTSIVNTSSNLISVTTPAHTAGVVDVVVTSGGLSTTLASAFTYVAIAALSAPTNVTAITPVINASAGFGIGATFTTTGAKSYRLEVYNSSGALVTSYNNYTSGNVIYGMAPSTTYSMILYSISDGVTNGSSGPSATVSTTTPGQATLATPATPTWTTASTTATSLVASVTAVTYATAYHWLLLDSTGTNTLRALDGSSAVTFAGLSPTTGYTVKVKAVGNGLSTLDSGYSTLSAVGTTSAGLTQLVAPAPSGGTVTSDSATFTIQPSTPAAVSYRIFLYAPDGSLVASQLAVASGSTATFTGLTSGVTYSAKEIAIGDGVYTATSALSPAVQGTTVSLGVSQFAAPSSVTQTNSYRNITVNWVNGSAYAPAGYFVYLYDGSGNLISRTSASGTSTTLTGTKSNTAYRLGVSAYYMNSLESNITMAADFTTAVDPTITVLSAPTTASSATSSSVIVSVTAATGGIGYRFSLYASDQTTLLSQINSSSLSYTFLDLAPATTYYYSVVSLGDGLATQSSSASTKVAATTLSSSSATQLSTPAAPSVTSSTTSITPTFTAAGLFTYLSYTLKIYDAAGTTLLATIPNFTSSTTINGLMPTTTYQLSLTAIGDGVNYLSSAESPKAAITTKSAIKLTAGAPVFGQPTPTSVLVYYTTPAGYTSSVTRVYDANQNLIMAYPGLTSGSSLSASFAPNTTYYVSVQFLGNGTTVIDSDESPKSAFTTAAAQKLVALRYP